MELVILTTSSLAVLGGLMISLFVPDGPYRKQSRINLSAFFGIFRNQTYVLRFLVFWSHVELYAFWAFTPLMLKTYSDFTHPIQPNFKVLLFFAIGCGRQ
jgi:hypothetical protein